MNVELVDPNVPQGPNGSLELFLVFKMINTQVFDRVFNDRRSSAALFSASAALFSASADSAARGGLDGTLGGRMWHVLLNPFL